MPRNQYGDSNHWKSSFDRISERAYNNAIGLLLGWGFLLNFLICRFATPIVMTWNLTAVVIGYFVIAVLGIIISAESDNAVVSFVGYNMVVVPLGVVLSIILQDYEQISILNAVRITGTVTVLMMFVGMVWSDFFRSMGKMLLFTLLAVLVSEIIFILCGIANSSWWDMGVAALFACYIAYDWCMAQDKPKTWDNAVDSVVELYLDIINLFVLVLAATSNKNNDND